MAQPTVSSHLKILEDAGVVSKELQGIWMIHRQEADSPSPYFATILRELRSRPF